jgi:hypothetical protein
MDIEQRVFDKPAFATATVAPGAANVAEVTITVRNVNGKPVGPVMLPVFITTSAQGLGLGGTAPTSLGCKTPGVLGNDIYAIFGLRVLLVQTLANGTYVLAVNDALKQTFYVAAEIQGMVQVMLRLATANYG